MHACVCARAYTQTSPQVSVCPLPFARALCLASVWLLFPLSRLGSLFRFFLGCCFGCPVPMKGLPNRRIAWLQSSLFALCLHRPLPSVRATHASAPFSVKGIPFGFHIQQDRRQHARHMRFGVGVSSTSLSPWIPWSIQMFAVCGVVLCWVCRASLRPWIPWSIQMFAVCGVVLCWVCRASLRPWIPCPPRARWGWASQPPLLGPAAPLTLRGSCGAEGMSRMLGVLGDCGAEGSWGAEAVSGVGCVGLCWEALQCCVVFLLCCLQHTRMSMRMSILAMLLAAHAHEHAHEHSCHAACSTRA